MNYMRAGSILFLNMLFRHTGNGAWDVHIKKLINNRGGGSSSELWGRDSVHVSIPHIVSVVEPRPEAAAAVQSWGGDSVHVSIPHIALCLSPPHRPYLERDERLFL